MSEQGSNGNGGKPLTPNKNQVASVSPDPAPQPASEEVIPASLDSALRSLGIDPHDPKISRALQVSLTMMFSGSLPIAPPPILREYGNIRPELIDKLIQWTEDQAKHRRDLERLRTKGAERRLNRGQNIGAVVAIGGLCLAALVGIFGNMWAAIVIAIVAVGGPTAAIVLAQHARKQVAPPTPAPSPPPPPQ
jgi:uncharacterized membrane protein